MFRLRAPALEVRAIIVSAAVLSAACSTPAPPKQGRPPVSVAVAKVRRTNVPYVIEANGVVTPLQSATVAAQVDGLVTEVAFSEGQDVSKGQVLFRIDARPYQAAYQQSLAALARDKSSAELAKGQFDRYNKLVSSGVVTAEQAETFRASYLSTSAVLQADSANLATAKFNLDNTTVRAPVTGRTGALLVRTGNLVRAGGGTPLVVINQVQPIMVRFAVPATELRKILKYGGAGGLPVTVGQSAAAGGAQSMDSLGKSDMSAGKEVTIDGARSGGRSGRSGSGSKTGAAAESAGGAAGAAPTGGRGRRGGGDGVAAGSAPAGDGRARGGPPGAGMPGARTGGATAGGDATGRGSRAGGSGPGGAAGGMGRGGAAGGMSAGRGQSADNNDTAVGTLTFIDNAVDTTTGTVQLKGTFPNRNGLLWVGQFVSASLQLYMEENVLVVPAQAVVTGQRGTYVYVIDSAKTARERPVVVERTTRGMTIITSGVSEGEQVVTDGQSRLNPGAVVDVRSPNDTGSASGRRGGRGGRGGDSTAAAGGTPRGSPPAGATPPAGGAAGTTPPAATPPASSTGQTAAPVMTPAPGAPSAAGNGPSGARGRLPR